MNGPCEIMKLPIVQPSDEPTAQALVRAIKRAGVILTRPVARETALTGATVFTQTERPGVHCANYATDVRVPNGYQASQVVDEITDHFKQHGVRCYSLEAAEAQWPESLARLIESHAFYPVTKQVFLLERHTPTGQSQDRLQVIPARAAYGQLHTFYQSMARHQFQADPKLATAFAQTMIDRLDEPRLELCLGRLRGKPVCVAGVVTLGQIGVIIAPHTDVGYRDQGIETTMITHVLDACARALMTQVILERTQGCASISGYESIGFTTVTSYEKYRRRSEGSSR